MIKKILKLEQIGKFSTLTQEKNFLYGEQNCNIIFGFNGSGKTTLSNIISFYADNSFISEGEKTTIYEEIKNSTSAVAEIELQDGNKCKYPANQHNKNIYVFNAHFVATHVFDGTKGKLKKFSNTAGEIENEAIKKANEKIKDLEAVGKKLKGENESLDGTLKTINKTHSRNFGSTLTDKNKRLTAPDLAKEQFPSETLDELQQELTGLVNDYDLSKRQEDLENNLTKLRQIVFQKCDLDLNKVSEVLNKNVRQLSKEVLENKIKKIKDLFEDETYKQSVEKWFRFGKSILDTAKEHGDRIECPICNTDLSVLLNDILKNFDGYFDKGYEDFIVVLKACKEQLQVNIDIITQCETNARNLGRLCEKYKNQLSEQTFTSFDFKTTKIELETILNACDSKLSNIQFAFTMSQSTLDSLSESNAAIDRFINLKNACLTALSARKFNTNKIEEQIRAVYNKMTLLEFEQSGEGGNFNKYKQNKNRIDAISTPDSTNIDGLLFYKNKLREELKKIKIESKSISRFLNIMGIDHFIIDINEDAPDENIIIKFSSSETDKYRLRNCLSDGEKTSLAFAYFLSKFKNERETEDKCSESVVVIDDPVSSLDENRLYSTAHLIRDNFKTARQLIVLSHNFLFLKFFNSSYGGKTNCLLLRGDKLSELPEELKNFESPYFYMLKNVMKFAEGTDSDSYQNAKKYLPNYIRRVLETFLSFKFANIKKDSGSRSPGLNDFDKSVASLNIEDSIKQELKLKIKNIAKIADQHSHGNAQLTEENFYIAEDELKELAQDAVTVIDIIDNVHKSNIIKPATPKSAQGTGKN